MRDARRRGRRAPAGAPAGRHGSSVRCSAKASQARHPCKPRHHFLQGLPSLEGERGGAVRRASARVSRRRTIPHVRVRRPTTLPAPGQGGVGNCVWPPSNSYTHFPEGGDDCVVFFPPGRPAGRALAFVRHDRRLVLRVARAAAARRDWPRRHGVVRWSAFTAFCAARQTRSSSTAWGALTRRGVMRLKAKIPCSAAAASLLRIPRPKASIASMATTRAPRKLAPPCGLGLSF